MKKLVFIMPLMAISLLANCGGGYKVIIPDIKGVAVSPLVVDSENDYSTTITIDKTITKQILPLNLKSVKIGENECEYNYLPNSDYLSATLTFAKSIVNNDITIDFSLRDRPWYSDNDYLSNLHKEDVTKDGGVIQTIEVNGQPHKVRLIDVDKDVDENDKTIHTTWEFVNLVSDENGYSLASLWQDTKNTSVATFDYLNSTIRKNLVGYGNGTIMWYEKDSATRSSRSQSVLDMLPDDLRSVLKIAKKKVNLKTTGSWVETDFTDELFLLSANEMNDQTEYTEKGEAYEYYKNAKPAVSDPIRIKQQVKGADGATTKGTFITDIACGSKGMSFAGYNSSTAREGAFLWLRSPNTNADGRSCIVSASGGISYSFVYDGASGVAPAFCI